jgi:hypothetical protein
MSATYNMVPVQQLHDQINVDAYPSLSPWYKAWQLILISFGPTFSWFSQIYLWCAYFFVSFLTGNQYWVGRFIKSRHKTARRIWLSQTFWCNYWPESRLNIHGQQWLAGTTWILTTDYHIIITCPDTSGQIATPHSLQHVTFSTALV